MSNPELNERKELEYHCFGFFSPPLEMGFTLSISKYLLNIKVGTVENNLIVLKVVLSWSNHTQLEGISL